LAFESVFAEVYSYIRDMSGVNKQVSQTFMFAANI